MFSLLRILIFQCSQKYHGRCLIIKKFKKPTTSPPILCLQRDYQGAKARLFTGMHEKKRGNKDKWKQKALRLSKEKHSHHEVKQTAEHADQSSHAVYELVMLPTEHPWNFFKTQLDKSLSNLVCPS